MNPKVIKRILIILLILIVIISIIVICINIQNDKGTSEEGTITKFEEQNTYVPAEKIEKIKNQNKYYTAKTLVERYMTYINDLDDEDDKLREATTVALTDILANEYKEEFNITNSNISDKYKNYKDDEVIEIKDIYLVEKNSSSNIFLVYGTMTVAQRDFQLMIKTNSSQMRFAIFPEEYMKKNNYSNDSKKEDFDEIISSELQESEYNKFRYVNISNERMAVEYFNDFKKKILYNNGEAYNILDEEYRNKRFENQEEFKNYVEKNQDYLSKIEINGYNVNNYDGYKIYTCKDQYENIYVFKETAIKEYTAKLDRYTIKDEEFINVYKKAKDQEKVAMNIDVWVQMINSRDYKAAYNVLDETFRNNYFKSVDDFENYMRQYFPLYYKVEFGNFDDEAGVYTQEIILLDVTKEDETQLQRTIIMKLKENTDFVMSMDLYRH